jgi:hypothetical protein
MRVYTIWPSDRDGIPAASSAAWHQTTRWLVLDVSDGLDSAHIVEGPVSRQEALHRESELRIVAKAARDRSPGSISPMAMDLPLPLQRDGR